ncbi:MAG: tetratricopeptide repeat protein [Thermoanaerobaculia bacterium]
MRVASFALCASLSLLPTLAAAAPVPAAAIPPAASYQFALGKLLAVEGSYDEAIAAFEAAEKAAPDVPETAYVLVEHAELLDRMAQYQRSQPLRDDSLRKAAEKISQARRLAPENVDVLRSAGQIYIDLATIDPSALATARDVLETVRKRDPGDAQSFLTLGRIYLDQNQPDKAAEVLRELVNNLPQQRMAYALLVESLMRANKPDEAQKALQDILGLDPSSLEARLTLADLQSRSGQTAAALATLRGAPEEVRGDSRFNRQLAWALYQNGELDAALKALDAVAVPAAGAANPPGTVSLPGAAGEAAPDPQRGLNLLRGLIFAAQGRNDEAIALMGKIHDAEPKDTGITVTLARVMQRAGRHDDAARLLDTLAATLEKDGKAKEAQEVRLEVAQVYFDGKRLDQVEETLRPLLTATDDGVRLQAVSLQTETLLRDKRYDEALALLGKEKDSPAVISKRAEVLSKAGRGTEAAKLLAGIAAGDEKSALAAAQTYQRLEKYQESIPVLEKLAGSHPDQAAMGFMLGAAYERSGQRDKAITEFRRVLKIDPDFHAALNYLGYTFAEAGTNLDEALKLVSRAVALDPDNGAYVDSLGWTYYRIGRPEQARDYLERAARLEPEDATLQEHLGDVYVALGQKERARQAYQRSLALGGENTDKVNTDKVRRKLDDLGKTGPHP